MAATPTREDPRDVLVARDGLTLGELPAGSVVGTGSPRRAAQLGALGLGLDVVPVRGNVDTRLELVHSGAVDAVVLARAGLARIGRLDEATETLDPLQMLPAPGQGALAVECREDRADVRAAVAALDDADTRACVTAERALLAALEAGCTAPVGALAEVVEGDDGPELSLRAFVGSTGRLGRAAPLPRRAGRRPGRGRPSPRRPAARGRRRRPRPDREPRTRRGPLARPGRAGELPDGIPRPLSTLTTNHQHHTEQVS